jgi:hypothetical protein
MCADICLGVSVQYLRISKETVLPKSKSCGNTAPVAGYWTLAGQKFR